MSVLITIVGGPLNGKKLRLGGTKKESRYFLSGEMHIKCTDGKYRPQSVYDAYEKHRTKKFRLTE